MKRKIFIISIIMLILTSVFTIDVYAQSSITSATITISSDKEKYNPGDTVEFTISLKNLQADKGIMTLGAYLEYDSNLLELDTTIKGLSGWTNGTINTETNRFIVSRDSRSSNNEDIAKISFKAKEVINDTSAKISLKKLELANGVDYVIDKVDSNSATITKSAISSGDNNPSTKPNTPSNPENPGNKPEENPENPNNSDNSDTPTDSGNNDKENNNTTTNQNDNKKDNAGNKGNNITVNNTTSEATNSVNKSNKKIPYSGTSSILIQIIGVVIIVSIILFIRLKLLNIKINKNDNDKNM